MVTQHEMEEMMLRQEVKNLIQHKEKREHIYSPSNGQLIVLLVLREHLLNFIFWNLIVDTIESEFRRLGYRFRTHVVDEENSWRQEDAAGYILLGDIPQMYVSQIEQLKKPIVWVDGEAEYGNFSQVRCNNQLGGYLLAKKAIELGHRHLACYCLPYRSHRERRNGVLQCVEAYNAMGVDCTFQDVVENTSDLNHQLLIEFLIRKDAPTFILCSSDSTAQNFYTVAENLMLKIPDDFSVVGFDNIKESYQMTPPLTTMDTQRIDMAIAAVELLIKKITVPMAANEMILIEPTLVMRKSLAPPGRKI